MAKVKVMDSARELEARAKQLFERIKGMNADMSATLEDMRQYEGKLIEKEKIDEKESAETGRSSVPIGRSGTVISRARGRMQGRRAAMIASASRSSSAMTGRSRASGANAPCRPQAN